MDVVKVATGAVALRRWSVALLVANIMIVLTGALVRLTDSGLGCPTWPRCTDESYVPHRALGYHGVIEFGNRLLTFVLIVIAVMTWISALRHRHDDGTRREVLVLTTVVAFGIPAQGVIGGITVLTQLNPFVVALHLLASMTLIALCVRLVRRVYAVEPRIVPRSRRILVVTTYVLMWIAVWLGTVVTGSGPHSGDRGAARTGFDGVVVSHVHAIGVYATVAGTLACLVLLRSRAALLLLIVELLQAVIGFVQYFNGVPVPLVALHLVGASLAIAAATNLLLSVRTGEGLHGRQLGRSASMPGVPSRSSGR